MIHEVYAIAGIIKMILETSKEAKESIESIEYLKDKLDFSAKIIEEKFSKFSRDLINETNKTI